MKNQNVVHNINKLYANKKMFLNNIYYITIVKFQCSLGLLSRMGSDAHTKKKLSV